MHSKRKISAHDPDAVDFSIRNLRVFQTVLESGSMAAAARHMSVSKSSVSQHIVALEKAVGATLLDRRTRPVTPTPAGRVLGKHARRILNAASAARTEMMQLDVSELTELRLGMIDDLDATLAPDLISHLAKAYPRSVFSVSSGLSDMLTTMIQARELDIAITAAPPDDATFQVRRILTEPFVLLCAHGLLGADGADRSKLESAPFIRYNPDIPIGRAIEIHLSRARAAYPQTFQFETSRSVFAAVVRLGGWAISTPLSILEHEQALRQVDIHPLPFPLLTRTVSLVARPQELDPLPARLANLCRRLLRDRVAGRLLKLTPWAGDTVIVHDG